jgi:colanic acid biosynthesis glycosyl transferase WcaI
MLTTFKSKGVPESKLVYFPNAIDLKREETPLQRGEFRKRHGFAEDEFLAVYAGNLGVKQGLGVLLETAALLQGQQIRFLVCGDGAQRDALAAQAKEMKLPNFSMLPLQAGPDYRALLVDADVCFITQQAGAGNSFFPSKLLGLLAQSKPVVTVAAPECELALSLEEGHFGVNVPPGQPQELAAVLEELAKDPERLREFGAAGRRYVEQFEKARVMQSFAQELRDVCSCS